LRPFSGEKQMLKGANLANDVLVGKSSSKYSWNRKEFSMELAEEG
jgi:hypothetical protein